MKRTFSFLFIALLCLLIPCAAMAETSAGRGEISIYADGLAAYLDGNGSLLIPGHAEPVNQRPAHAIISIDPYRLIYLSCTADDAGIEKTALVSINLTTFEETVLNENVYAACSADSENLYFISADDRTQLYRVDFENDLTAVVYTSAESLDQLYVSADGMVVTYVEDAGAVIYVAATDSFEPYGDPVSTKTLMTDDGQVYIADTDVLYIRRLGSSAADAIDMNVSDFALLGGNIYYLANTGSALRIKVYDPELMEQKVLSTPDLSLEAQLTASQNSLFALGADKNIYRIDPETGSIEFFASIQTPQLDAGSTVSSYSIQAMSGLLNVYASITSDAPEFTFMEYTSDMPSDSDAELMLIQSLPLEGEELAWTLLQPAAQYSPLRRGNRGDAVSAIQQPLYDHGYYNYYIDGIFGYRTHNAISLLQSDLGDPVTGIADEDLQRLILSGNFPSYDPYVQLSRGDKGLRVTHMQQRLRALGYLADGADGIFGSRTQSAVELFQRENGLAVAESATRDTLMKLYSDSAASCSSYIDLMQGDSGYRVRELNKRLKELFYLDGSVLDSYTSATSEAIRSFQAQAGYAVDGSASVALQQHLFSADAPECSGYSELRRGDENTRVARLQRRLKELNYFTGNVTGYFGRQTQSAVKLFQQKVGLRQTGVASVALQEKLFASDAPKYVKPTVIGTPVITIDCCDKRDGGIYYLSDASSETGCAVFSWAAEGYVDTYNVSIKDDQGNVCIERNTELTMLSVPISSLTLGRVYTLTVTAYPEDGDSAHITSAELRFCRTEVPEEPVEIGTISAVHVSIDDVSRTENDVCFVKPGAVTFHWYAEGDVASYCVEIRNAAGESLLKTSTSDEYASIQTTPMAEGEVYTLCVYAIPTNGTIEHATLKTLSFALDVQSGSTPSLTAPVLSVANATADENGVFIAEASEIELRWDAVENAVQYQIEVRDAAGAFCTGGTTMETAYALNVSELTDGNVYTVFVTAIPEDGSITETATASIQILIPVMDSEPTEEPTPVSSEKQTEVSTDVIPSEESESSIDIPADVSIYDEPESSDDPSAEVPMPEGSEPSDDIPADALISDEPEVPDDIPTEAPAHEEPEPVYKTPAEVPTPAESESPDDTPTEAPVPEESEPADDIWNTPLDTSDSTRISAVQQRLVKFGWLSPDAFIDGQLDEATISAVYAFQMNCNTSLGSALIPITAENPVIDVDTLTILMLTE